MSKAIVIGGSNERGGFKAEDVELVCFVLLRFGSSPCDDLSYHFLQVAICSFYLSL
jgi:hypothetical protein